MSELYASLHCGKEICKWRKNGFHMKEHNYWETGCSNLFQFTNDGPKENHFEWCPYCGNLIEVTE